MCLEWTMVLFRDSNAVTEKDEDVAIDPQAGDMLAQQERLSATDRDRQVAILHGYVPARIAGMNAQRVVPRRQPPRLPHSGGRLTVAKRVGHHVQKTRAPFTVERDSTTFRIDESRSLRITQAIESYRHARRFETGRRRAVGVENLIAQLEHAETAIRPIAVGLIPCVDHDADVA